MKSIYKRMKYILTSNVNALIDHAEDPEKMIQQIIRAMGANICCEASAHGVQASVFG